MENIDYIISLLVMMIWGIIYFKNKSNIGELLKASALIIFSTITLLFVMYFSVKYIPNTKAVFLDKDNRYNVALISAVIAGISFVYNKNENEKKRLFEERKFQEEKRINQNREERKQKNDRYDRLINLASILINETTVILSQLISIERKIAKWQDEYETTMLDYKAMKQVAPYDIGMSGEESLSFQENMKELHQQVVNKIELPYLRLRTLLYDVDEIGLNETLEGLHSIIILIIEFDLKHLEINNQNSLIGLGTIQRLYRDIKKCLDDFQAKFIVSIKEKQKLLNSINQE